MRAIRLAVSAHMLIAAAACGSDREEYPPDLPDARIETYKVVDGVSLNLWIFTPKDHKPGDRRAAAVFFFGGGWNSGSPSQFEHHCRHLASLGMVGITADYRVKSRHNAMPADCVSDAKAAIRWVRANSAKLGIDPARIAACGGSAGGHLAACTGTLDEFEVGVDSPSSRPNAMVLFNPVLVLAPIKGKDFRNFTATLPAERVGTDPSRISPAHNVKPGTPPAVIFHGRADAAVPFETAEAFAEAMKAAGNRCELVGFEHQWHGFFNYSPAGNRYYTETLRMMDRFFASLGYVPAMGVALRPVNFETGMVLAEAESFESTGGWVVDPQFADQMGSPFLLAHGLGRPVSNAVTSIDLPSTGEYRLWVRTRDWTPDSKDHPGRFKVIVNGLELQHEFGTVSGEWSWQDGGKIDVPGTTATIALKDMTGFEGRCDAVLFVKDGQFVPPDGGSELAALRKKLAGELDRPAQEESVDLVVVGGGVAGCCASLAAAREGLRVALIHDRPVFGGNASSEIRVRTEGRVDNAIVESMRNLSKNTRESAILSDANRLAILENTKGLDLVHPWRAYGVAASGGHILAIDARKITTGEVRRFRAPLFVDCTGDAWIGYWAGAEYRMGREAASEFGEHGAPPAADRMTMGSSLMWTSRDAGRPVSFPEVPWALAVAGKDAALGGEWDWEYGMEHDTIRDAEYIRDHLFRAIYGNFYNARQKPGNEKRELHWVPYIAGKRESRRLVGAYMLTENDVAGGGKFDDAVALGSWDIDVHVPVSPGSYRSRAVTRKVSTYGIPFRCLYSRNIDNLMMAGRNISATHMGLGGPRVQHTTGQMGVAAGYAAALCLKYSILPRDICGDKARLRELQRLIGNYLPVPEK